MKRKGRRVARRVIRQLKAADEREVAKAKQTLKGSIRYLKNIASDANSMASDLTRRMRKATWTEDELDEAISWGDNISDIVRDWL